MHSSNEKILVIVISLVLLLIFVAGIASYGITFSRIYDFLVLEPIKNLLFTVNNTFQNIENYFMSVKKGAEVIKENEDLKNEIEILKARLKLLLGYYTENQELRNLLGIKSKLTLNMKGAHVIFYDELNNFIVIDIGENDGITEKMPVVYSNDGENAVLVGIIQSVNEKTSKVMLITNKAFRISVTNSSRYGVDILEGTGDALSITKFSYKLADNIGDVFVTTELSDIYPPNIFVGKLVKIENKNVSEKKLTLLPILDFYKIKNVLVITSYEKK
ncbi:MAG: rod shape-determining protein MreC [Caldisericaceae bacterium]